MKVIKEREKKRTGLMDNSNTDEEIKGKLDEKSRNKINKKYSINGKN